MKNLCAFVVALGGIAALASSQSQATAMAVGDATTILARAQTLCEADASKLWGVSLCVPMMIADRNTRQAFTNRILPDARAVGNIFRLTLPRNALISSAPTQYQGIRWAQLEWPMYGSADTRAATLMHESFHIIQPKLGFNGDADNGSISGDAYLDTQAGRVWLRGEFQALRVALRTTGHARLRALQDAISMRLYRHSLSLSTAELERMQDILEGLAEGTGIDAGLPPSRRIAYALYDIAYVEAQPSYERAFPYATGPAYSELLDAAQQRWRRAVTSSSDLAHMTMRAYSVNVTAPMASEAQAIIANYGGAAIESQESRRAARKLALDEKYTRELVHGATITLPMAHFSIRFNPRDIEVLVSYGSIYHTLTVTAPWGAITVSGGAAMIARDFRFLYVAAPPSIGGSTLHGNGWSLHLAPGYAIGTNPKKVGSYLVTAPH